MGLDQAKVEPPPLRGTCPSDHPVGRVETTHKYAHSHCETQETAQPVHGLDFLPHVAFQLFLRDSVKDERNGDGGHCPLAIVTIQTYSAG